MDALAFDQHDDTAGAAGTAEAGDDSFYDRAYDYGTVDEQPQQAEELLLPDEADIYEGYEWDEATAQYYPTTAGANNSEHDGEGNDIAPPSPFKNEAYWEQEVYNQRDDDETEEAGTDLNAQWEDGADESSPAPLDDSVVGDFVDSSEVPRAAGSVLKKLASQSKTPPSSPSSSTRKPKKKVLS